MFGHNMGRDTQVPVQLPRHRQEFKAGNRNSRLSDVIVITFVIEENLLKINVIFALKLMGYVLTKNWLKAKTRGG